MKDIIKEVHFAPMQEKHLTQVLAIEKNSFSLPWPRQSFVYELQHNNLAYYLVALHGADRVVGYAGMWIILDEAHITNVAVHPHYRCCKIGTALMLEMIDKALLLGAEKMTLEVRTSNKPARNLYKNLGFMEKGVRKKYYSDTQEDAIIMWKDIGSATRAT